MELDKPIIKETSYNNDGVDDFKLNDSEKELILQYPTVYIVNDKKKETFDVYVGETNNIKNRTYQHLQEDRDDWEKFNASNTAKLIVMGHSHFNKSLTLDIENKMRLYMTGVGSVKRLNNRRGNPQGHYYTSNEVDQVFRLLWENLHNLNGRLFPSRAEVEQSALFKSSPFHQLTDDQIKSKDYLMLKITEAMNRDRTDQLMIVEGAAGTGKTVLLSSLFFDLLADNAEDDVAVYQHKKVALLVNHDEQVKVYKSIANKLGDDKAVIMKPNEFINKYFGSNEQFDAVIVDEGHLLATRNGQAFSRDKGKTHLEVIRKLARVTVLVYDPHQILTTEQYFPKKDFVKLRKDVAEKGNLLTLKHQMRISAGQQTINWLDDFVFKHHINSIPSDSSYDLQIFDDPEKMYDAIKYRANQPESELSRVLATYDWEWKPDGQEYDVATGDFRQPWNYYYTKRKDHVAWAENPESINEVGSTFTIQGFDLNYAGVIIGESVQYRDGKVVFNPNNSFSGKAKQKPGKGVLEDEDERQSVPFENLNNELNVLLSRGVNGLYIYAVDEALREKLLEAFGKNVYNSGEKG
ncbi:DUF2075 domain-containing protein [Eupransor demetentiae]|uniref:DUF2075 family (BH3996) n=1 Tax=Eupransor demetentiae TaxID=3109584 RepID=A0ABM9N690_9LACO|nr:DUF2075 family (BH3996) [Lactobacillaceae bacterium LMG 33000]